MWFDGKNKEQEKKQKTAVAVAYECLRERLMVSSD